MGLRLHTSSSRNSESFYISQDYTDPKTKKRTTRIYKKLGTFKQLQQEHGFTTREEAVAYLKEVIEQEKKAKAENEQAVPIYFSPNELVSDKEEQSFNVSYMFIEKVLSILGLKEICEKIQSEYKFSYNLNNIAKMLVETRILYPGSKKSCLEDSGHFFDHPKIELQSVYRALPVLAQNRYQIEAELYKNSQKIVNRDSCVLYYDCTNFYFEIEEEDDFRKYGHSKENRPNPIVQYGLFVDSSHIPVADCVFPGNQNEQASMAELEKILEKDFKLSKFVVCADAGLNCFENKLYNDRKSNGAYIVTQPIKKMTKSLKTWTIDPEGWRIPGSRVRYNLDSLPETVIVNGIQKSTDEVTFYKDRWVKTTRKSKTTGKKETIDEHLIVSFSRKYQKYQEKIRDRKIERAKKLLKDPGKIETQNQRNPRYYISRQTYESETGEIIEKSEYKINYDKVAEEQKLDGFYAVVTDLEDSDICLVLDANHQRWEIEECFEIMKSELETRPIYVQNKESIEGHLLTCFIALTVYRILEAFLGSRYTVSEIFETLRNMNITYLQGPYYKPVFKSSDMIEELTGIFGYEFRKKLLDEKNLKKYERNAKSKNVTQFMKTFKSEK